MPFNVAGYPAMSVCAGFGPSRLPLSLQIVGKPFQEAKLLQIADAFETASGFRANRPAMAG
jgi:aspartyl-tRNA(Asn)/glutamyl-tRNA(Gln) amidotransferase subunit A